MPRSTTSSAGCPMSARVPRRQLVRQRSACGGVRAEARRRDDDESDDAESVERRWPDARRRRMSSRPTRAGRPSAARRRTVRSSPRSAISSARGQAVTFYPFILMDIPPGNSLPDPYGGTAQARLSLARPHHARHPHRACRARPTRRRRRRRGRRFHRHRDAGALLDLRRRRRSTPGRTSGRSAA